MLWLYSRLVLVWTCCEVNPQTSPASNYWRLLIFIQLLSHVWLFATPWTAAHQTSLSFNISCIFFFRFIPLSEWCYLTISSTAALFSFCLPYFPASGSFSMNRLFPSGSQMIGASIQHQSSQWILRTDSL